MRALLSNINLEPLASSLDISYFAAYDQIITELKDPSKKCHDEAIKQVWVHVDSEEFLKDFLYSTDRSFPDECFHILLNSLKDFAKNQKTLILSFLPSSGENLDSFLSPLQNPTSPSGLWSLEKKWQEALYQLCQTHPNVFFLPLEACFNRLGREKTHDPKFWYLGRIKYSRQGLKAMVETFEHLQNALQGPCKKALVMDLDNTLWGGILGEDGVEGIQIGSEGLAKVYQDIQKILLGLKERGCILCLCSKNDEEEVKQLFHTHPHMPLKWEDFAATRVNWLPKDENILSLAEELNLSLSSMVFVDDNPVERELVSALKTVTVPGFPSTVSDYPTWMLQKVAIPYFSKVSLTSEDRHKSRHYQQQAARHRFKKGTSLQEFLKRLDIHLTLFPSPEDQVARLSQLTQKTNQFNLTLKRYNEGEMAAVLQDKSCFVLSGDYKDKFGEEGIVALLIFRLDKGKAFIENFLLSCRVIGRHVEKALFSSALCYLKEKQIHTLEGHFVPGPRNASIKKVLEDLGMEPYAENTWRQDLDTLLKNPHPLSLSVYKPQTR